jgi:hypothetical protein
MFHTEAGKNSSEVAARDINLGLTNISALIEGAFRKKQAPSELRSELSKIGSEYKLSPEVVGQAVLRKVDELSQEEPLEPAASGYLSELCEDIEMPRIKGETVDRLHSSGIECALASRCGEGGRAEADFSEFRHGRQLYAGIQILD